MEIPEAPYNYCDYRCPKCPWTEHCAVYQQEMSERLVLEAEGVDPDTWEGTLEIVRRNFERARQMLQKDAERFDIDLSEPAELPPEPPETGLERRAHDCGLRLHELSKKITASEEFAQLREILVEAYEDLMWNHLLFVVKLKRAMDGLWEYQNEPDDEFRDIDLSDGIKSAEVSIRAMETNRQALTILADKIPPLAKQIRKEIAELEQIQKDLEAEVRKHRPDGKD